MTKLLKIMMIISAVVIISAPLYAKSESNDTIVKDTETSVIEKDTDSVKDQPAEYTAGNSRHRQVLGGRSRHASNGLAKAARRSSAIRR